MWTEEAAKLREKSAGAFTRDVATPRRTVEEKRSRNMLRPALKLQLFSDAAVSMMIDSFCP